MPDQEDRIVIWVGKKLVKELTKAGQMVIDISYSNPGGLLQYHSQKRLLYKKNSIWNSEWELLS